MDIWTNAEEVASGKRGDYPFDEAGKKALLKDLEAASSLLEKMVVAGTFRKEEGELLKLDLADLVRGVQEKRPTEMVQATCYEPMMAQPVVESFQRLSARLAHLESLAGEHLSPMVLEKVLAKMETDLQTLKKRTPEEPYDKVDETKAKELETRLKILLEKCKKAQ